MRNLIASDGSNKQYSSLINGIKYLIKVGKKHREEIVSEYIVSSLLADFGVNVQETHLFEKRGVVCVACRDFTSEDDSLVEYMTVAGQQYTPLDYNFDSIDNNLRKKFGSNSSALHQFWEMCVWDAIVANDDRHGRNWGFLVNGDIRMAPVYDNGNSLFSGNAKIMLLRHENMKKAISKSVYGGKSKIRAISPDNGRIYVPNLITFMRSGIQQEKFPELGEAYFRIQSIGFVQLEKKLNHLLEHELIFPVEREYIRGILLGRYKELYKKCE